jgi:hypothetical protein
MGKSRVIIFIEVVRSFAYFCTKRIIFFNKSFHWNFKDTFPESCNMPFLERAHSVKLQQ